MALAPPHPPQFSCNVSLVRINTYEKGESSSARRSLRPGPGSSWTAPRLFQSVLRRVYKPALRRAISLHSSTPATPFRINTCKSASKQRTLTSFRMNTYKKRGEGANCSSVFFLQTVRIEVKSRLRPRRLWVSRASPRAAPLPRPAFPDGKRRPAPQSPRPTAARGARNSYSLPARTPAHRAPRG
jgi:hypothetical protein